MDLNTLILIAFSVVILIYSIIIHEVAHGFIALWLGDATAKYAGRLTFNPLKHIDPMGSILVPIFMLIITGFRFALGSAKPVPYNPYNLKNQKWGPVLVALGGPGSNIALALLAVLMSKVIAIPMTVKIAIITGIASASWDQVSTAVAGSFGSIFFAIFMIVIFWNVILAFFNLIPLPPLDGSKLLFAIFPMRQEVMILLEQYGFIMVLIVILFFAAPLGNFLYSMLNIFFGLAL